ncbi:MAG: hypothetical protein CVU34_11810 [Betaproteobacteria bacterium HGW-Betaproteobacteria-7]|jgi:hypothetical protein|nr:MAG: hypothetical protein CVU34_11810 [Betaproteobacteria bacterium HGW-Betaproteobacteria-7]
MLRPTNDLLNLASSAKDGAIGDVKDLYFDDEAWALLPGYAGYGSPTAIRAEAAMAQTPTEARQGEKHPRLRSCKAVVGYYMEAIDGELGHVQGLLVDEDSWAIRYLVVRTSNWWLGHDVLVAPQWIKRGSWADRTVAVDLTRDTLKQAPRYDPTVPLSREMEIAVFKHYGRAGYWSGADPASDRVILSQANEA